MKFLYIPIFIFTFLIIPTDAQDFKGDWQGSLKVQGVELVLIWHVSAGSDGALKGALDVPAQGAKDIPFEVKIKQDSAYFNVPAIKATFGGLLKNQELVGIYKQGPFVQELALKDNQGKGPVMNRPQEPKAPFPYNSEDITFENKFDNIKLAGTLTYPKKVKNGLHKAVVLVTGSGPQDRNEELFGHKPFKLIADQLTKKGFVVLRYDDRGVGKSTGVFSDAHIPDFVTDANAGVAYLNTLDFVDKKQIGIIGHSEGGIVAAMAASKNKDIAYIAMLAGPGVLGRDLLLKQQKDILSNSGLQQAQIDRTMASLTYIVDLVLDDKIEDKRKGLTSYFEEAYQKNREDFEGYTIEEAVDRNLNVYNNKWMKSFLRTDPSEYLKTLKIPVFSMIGSKDIQVNAAINNKAILESIEGKNKKSKVITLPNLNHMFQTCNTGMLNEYAMIEQTMTPKALEELSSWLLEL